jgi:two-component system, cell cycle sensor histidine kinase and response regulator CckA
MPVGKETILVVEDDAGVRRLTVGMLKRLGYNILQACNGAEALRLCRQSDQPIGLVLTDVVMPEMSGFAFVNALLGEQPNMRVLFMSGYTEEAISQHGTLGPGMMVMQKPFEIRTLASKVREVLEG